MTGSRALETGADPLYPIYVALLCAYAFARVIDLLP